MTKDAKILVGVLCGPLLILGPIALALSFLKPPTEKAPTFPFQGWTYGRGGAALYRSAEEVGTCEGLGGAAGTYGRAESRRQEADSMDKLVKATRDAGRAAQRVERAMSGCSAAIMVLEPGTDVTIVGREGTAFRVVVTTPQGKQPGWVSVDRVDSEALKK